MFSLNVSCAVCKAIFNNVDTVYSTDCGHVFHFSCWNKSQCQSTSCPVCRNYNPKSHPLYLNFENGIEFESILNDLKVKLEESEEKFKKIQGEVEKKVKKIDDLKRLYNVSEKWREELQYKIQTEQYKEQQQIANTSEESKSNLAEAGIIQNHEILENIDDNLKLSNEKLIAENIKLKKNLSESETLRIMLNQKIEILEQRLKYVTEELQKQFIESLKNEKKESLGITCNTTLKQPNKKRNRNKEGKEKLKVEKVSAATDVSALAIKNDSSLKLKQPNDTRIIIQNFPKGDVVYPLSYTVTLLASKMAVNISSEHISNAYILNSRDIFATFLNVFIVVEFKNIETKDLFLKNSNRLKFYSTTKHVKLKEFVDEHIYSVFMYANRHLRAKGIYEYIAIKDGKVIAKKKPNDSEEIIIENQKHVEDILRGKKDEFDLSFRNRNARSIALYKIHDLKNTSSLF